MRSLFLLALCTAHFTFVSCNSNALKRRSSHDDASFFLCSVRDGVRRHDLNAQRFGFFSSLLWKDYEENLRREIDVFGAVPGYVLWYLQIGDDFPVDIAEVNRKLGIHTVINQDLKCDGLSQERNEAVLREIIDGKWDDLFRRFARQAHEADDRVYYRFGYEMNGDWFPWGQKSDLYVAAWRHTWTLFHKEKASNVKWIFSPGVVWGQKTFQKDILPYYPGDDYVDIVALDGYNFGDNHDEYHEWESFHKVFAPSLSGLMALGKPMWIAEIGCPSDPRRHKWLQDFLDFFDTNGCFEVFFWFNENKDHEPNFRIDGDAASLHIFRDWAQRGKQKLRVLDELAGVKPGVLGAPPHAEIPVAD